MKTQSVKGDLHKTLGKQVVVFLPVANVNALS